MTSSRDQSGYGSQPTGQGYNWPELHFRSNDGCCVIGDNGYHQCAFNFEDLMKLEAASAREMENAESWAAYFNAQTNRLMAVQGLQMILSANAETALRPENTNESQHFRIGVIDSDHVEWQEGNISLRRSRSQVEEIAGNTRAILQRPGSTQAEKVEAASVNRIAETAITAMDRHRQPEPGR